MNINQLFTFFSRKSVSGDLCKNNTLVQETKQWSEKLLALTLLDAITSTKDKLNELINCDVDIPTRLAVLPIIEKALSSFVKNYEKRSLDGDQEVLVQNFDGIITIHQLLVKIYQEISDDQSQKLLHSKEVLLSVFFYQLYHLGRIIYLSFACHQVPRAQVWYEFHQAYLKSKKLHLHKKTYLTPTDLNCKVSTVEDIYKHYLLFSCVDPLRFRANTVRQLFFLTQEWVSLLNLSTKNDTVNTSYYIDSNSDAPPRRYKQGSQQHDNQIKLDLSKISERVHTLLEALRSNKQNSPIKFTDMELSISLYIAEKISISIAGSGDRKIERIKCLKPLETSFGLQAIFDNQDKMDNKIHTRIVVPNEAKQAEMEEIVLDASSLPGQYEGEQPVSNPGKLHAKYLCEMLDYSDTGYCMKCEGKIPSNLLSGEIIGMHINHACEVGIIRWVANNSVTTFGVEIIARNCVPAMARSINKQSKVNLPVLFIDTDGCYVITPHLPFVSNDSLEVSTSVTTFELTLKESMPLSASYKKNVFEGVLPSVFLNNKTSVQSLPKSE